MASATLFKGRTVADLLEHLHVPPERILLHPPPGEAIEKDVIKSRRICELIDGVLVEKLMGFSEFRIAAVLIVYLGIYLKEHKLGIVVGESGFMRVAEEQVRVPDVAFYSWKQFPENRVPRIQIHDRVPELAVEVLSPSNTKKEMERKRREYFAGRAQLVWEVHPDKQIVNVFTAPDEMTTIDKAGAVDGGNVLPGFTLSLKEWFDEAGERA